MDSLPRALIIAGVALVVVGVLLQLAPSLPVVGKLPGDIRIERPGFRLYVPITTCLLVSVVLSGLLWIFARFR